MKICLQPFRGIRLDSVALSPATLKSKPQHKVDPQRLWNCRKKVSHRPGRLRNHIASTGSSAWPSKMQRETITQPCESIQCVTTGWKKGRGAFHRRDTPDICACAPGYIIVDTHCGEPWLHIRSSIHEADLSLAEPSAPKLPHSRPQE